MVCVDIFESNAKSQTLRTLIALTVLILGDLFYLFITQNTKKFWNNKMAFLNIWVIVGIILGVSVLRNNDGDYVYEHSKRDHAYYGILIGLVVYVPMNSWLSSGKIITSKQSLYHTAFGIFVTSFASLITYMIAEASDVIEPN